MFERATRVELHCYTAPAGHLRVAELTAVRGGGFSIGGTSWMRGDDDACDEALTAVERALASYGKRTYPTRLTALAAHFATP